MTLLQPIENMDHGHLGREMHAFAADLYPICRSITGNGIRETLNRIGKRIPLKLSEVPTGKQVLDWTVPMEWNIRDAYVADSAGKRVVDFHKSNLHVLNYSIPIHRTMPLEELKPHLHSLPQHPDWIPYRTSYYQEDWGFCLRHRQLEALAPGNYDVCIDSTLEPGSLTYGECFLPGKSSDEVLISCHACHPSLANDNLSGLAVATFLAGMLAQAERRYSYRFVFIPGTIGAITWLAQNSEAGRRIKHGLVLTCVGDAGGFHYKKSRDGAAEIDRAAAHVLRHCGESSEVLEFSPYGYDERQYCSPGFNLAIGCLMRSVWGSFPEYHSSADNLEFLKPQSLAGSLKLCAEIVDALEGNRAYRNESPYGEPQLGKRGLYHTTGGQAGGDEIMARLWVLNLSDGKHSLLEIAERSGMRFFKIRAAADLLIEKGLLAEVAAEGARGSSA